LNWSGHIKVITQQLTYNPLASRSRYCVIADDNEVGDRF
jgi:hypothetical protein